jgi:hypothetical protein
VSTFDLDVTYRDGTVATIRTDQYSVSVWERWAAKAGLRTSMKDPEPLAFTQLRVMAWAETQRDSKAKVAFEVWDATVQEVNGSKPVEADPTHPATSAG